MQNKVYPPLKQLLINNITYKNFIRKTSSLIRTKLLLFLKLLARQINAHTVNIICLKIWVGWLFGDHIKESISTKAIKRKNIAANVAIM